MRQERPEPRRVFLARPPGPGEVPTGEVAIGEPVELGAEEEQHLTRVLRASPGDELIGLDGVGGSWPLTVESVRRSHARVVLAGPVTREPGPGALGAALPWIEVALAWPRKTRLEETLGPLVQLGAAAITPLACARRSAEPIPEAAPERWWRLAREACKQSRRTWLPRLGGPMTPAELVQARGQLRAPGAGAHLVRLEPGAPERLDVWLAERRAELLESEAQPLVLCIGPEGGFDRAEREALASATELRLAPHVLRIETAATAAMSVAACVLG